MPVITNQTAWPCNNCRSIERAKSVLKSEPGHQVLTNGGKGNQPDESGASGSGDTTNGLAHTVRAA